MDRKLVKIILCWGIEQCFGVVFGCWFQITHTIFHPALMWPEKFKFRTQKALKLIWFKNWISYHFSGGGGLLIQNIASEFWSGFDLDHKFKVFPIKWQNWLRKSEYRKFGPLKCKFHWGGGEWIWLEKSNKIISCLFMEVKFEGNHKFIG